MKWFLLEILPKVNLPSWNCSHSKKQFNYHNPPSLGSSLWIQRMIKGFKVLSSDRAAPIHLGLESSCSYPVSVLTLELGTRSFFSLSSPVVGWRMLQCLGWWMPHKPSSLMSQYSLSKNHLFFLLASGTFLLFRLTAACSSEICYLSPNACDLTKMLCKQWDL